MNFFLKMLPLAIVFSLLNIIIPTPQAQSPPGPKCKEQSNPSLNFNPKAFTLTQANIREQSPEYSLLKGQWLMGKLIDVLPPNSCLAILEKKMVGVIQIWYFVKYQKDGTIKTGWVWGGTKDVDETHYIGGDTTPERQGEKQSFFKIPLELSSFFLFGNVAHAQADPSARPTQKRQTSLDLVGQDEKAIEYYWKMPILNWTLSVGAASAIFLYIAMVFGMFAKALWDQTEVGRIVPSLAKILRPLLISPIAFSAFWGPMYIQQGSAGISLTMTLYAFQIGFMWQHVLEKRLAAGVEGKKT